MSLNRPKIKYAELFSSGGNYTTVGPDEVINIVNGAGDPVISGSIAIEFVTDCNINFNGDTGYHQFAATDKLNFDSVSVSSIRVQTAGSIIRFFGVSI